MVPKKITPEEALGHLVDWARGERSPDEIPIDDLAGVIRRALRAKRKVEECDRFHDDRGTLNLDH
jgi:hypothetical protein